MSHARIVVALIVLLSSAVPAADVTGSKSIFQYGGIRETLAQRQDQARVALDDVAGRAHVYAVGALAGLEGEVTILDSVLVTTARDRSGGLVALDGESLSATILVGSIVTEWFSSPVSEAVDAAGFDAAIRATAMRAGLDPASPFPFVVEGTMTDVRLHVIHGACPVHARMHDVSLDADRRPFELESDRIEGTVVGIHAEGAVGVLTHPDTSVHSHLVWVDAATGANVTGHLEARGIAVGATIRVAKGHADE